MINKYKITEFLSNKELPSYLNIAKDVGNHDFILKYRPKIGDFATFIAEQSGLSAKAKLKLPSFEKAGCIFTQKSFEQCTAEAVARYKATVIEGQTILTLAAGLGADDVAFAKHNEKVISIDNDESLNAIAKHNFKLLGINNIERRTISAEEFMKANTMKFDNIYIDPDRRIETQRQILLSQHQPDIIKLLPDLLKISDNIWIKCSPLYDIDMAMKEIPLISEIHCISHKGEVKELLLRAGNSVMENIRISCTDIGTRKTITSSFESQNLIPAQANEISGYFYEAGSTLVKCRKNHTYASEHGLKLIDNRIPFYTGEKIIPDFIGKCLRIENCIPFNAKQIRIYLKAKQITHINIKIRGLSSTPETLYKKLGLKEGGNDFLFICPFKSGNVAIHCQPLQ